MPQGNIKSFTEIADELRGSQQSGDSVDRQKKKRQSQGLPVSVRQDRSEPTLAGGIIRDVVKTPARLMRNVTGIADVIKGDGENATQPVRTGYLGDVSPIGATGNFGKDVKESIGAGIELSSFIPGAGGAKTAVSSATRAVSPFLKNTGRIAGQEATAGALGGLGRSIQDETKRDDTGAVGRIAGNTLAGALGGAVGGGALSTATQLARPITRGITKAFTEGSESFAKNEISDIIKQGVNTGLRPSNAERKTLSKARQFDKQAEEGIKALINRSDSISVKDAETGEVVQRLPKNNIELPSAIEDAKQKIWDDISSRIKSAEGSTIDVSPVIRSLTTLAQDVRNLPQTRQYAMKALGSIAELNGQSPSVIQGRIRAINEQLGGYFRATDPKTLGNAKVDLEIKRGLDKALEGTLAKSNTPGIKELKSRYAGLKQLEKSAQKAANKELRKMSGPDTRAEDVGIFLYGALTANPQLVASSLASQGLRGILRALNDPNRATSKMFSRLLAIKGRYPGLFSINDIVKGSQPEQLLLPEARNLLNK